VADACPLIFLAAIQQLPLIERVFPVPVRVPAAVYDEILRDNPVRGDAAALRAFLEACQRVEVTRPGFPSNGLSSADRAVLTLAVERKDSVILSDDSLLRRTALARGLRVVGTLGLLIRASRAGFHSPAQSREFLDELISRHGFRISIELYQEALKQLLV
jgi:hypothetical protein